ncbi:helix-turn-helix transcriptional regulator [uncultured Clostridium sp.]|uniref:helix-turn-helix domain-containing protein n=1 Tax=uncultured Clostridium sp. TaxID=59620 RepID=UPI00260DD773|nr:helix-turn-helix transcriptional regulator [uncultured Clostridium sp.]
MKYNELKKLMKDKNYSQKKLADRLKISKQTLNLKMNGKAPFLILEAVEIINILKIENPKEIFFEE